MSALVLISEHAAGRRTKLEPLLFAGQITELMRFSPFLH